VSQEPSETEGGSSDEDGPLTVRDDQLPDDLQPGEDNPLAQPAEDDVPDDLLKQEAAAHAGSGEHSEDAGTGVDDASGSSSSTASSEGPSTGPSESPSESPDDASA
jgi:hypothetical protein